MFSFLFFFALLARLAIAFVYLYILCASHLHEKARHWSFFDSHFSKEGPSVLYIAHHLFYRSTVETVHFNIKTMIRKEKTALINSSEICTKVCVFDQKLVLKVRTPPIAADKLLRLKDIQNPTS